MKLQNNCKNCKSSVVSQTLKYAMLELKVHFSLFLSLEALGPLAAENCTGTTNSKLKRKKPSNVYQDKRLYNILAISPLCSRCQQGFSWCSWKLFSYPL